MKNFTSTTGDWNLKISKVDSIMAFEIIGNNIYTMETKTLATDSAFVIGAVTKNKVNVFKRKISFDVSETLRLTSSATDVPAKIKVSEFNDKVIFSMRKNYYNTFCLIVNKADNAIF